MKTRILLFTLCLMLASCIVVKPQEVVTEAEIDMPLDALWAEAMTLLAERGFVVESLDEEAGRITAEKR